MTIPYTASPEWQGGQIEVTGDSRVGYGISQRFTQDGEGPRKSVSLFPLGWASTEAEAVREAAVHAKARGAVLLVQQRA